LERVGSSFYNKIKKEGKKYNLIVTFRTISLTAVFKNDTMDKRCWKYLIIVYSATSADVQKTKKKISAAFPFP
jgi:hypothetical protein